MESQTKTPKKLWKPPSFDDFNIESPSKKIKLDPVCRNRGASSRTERSAPDDSVFVQVSEPKTIDELATHSRKIEEVKKWFETNRNRKGPILLVTGPSGSAKTTTVKVTARSLSFSIAEWINPIDKLEFKNERLIGSDPYDKCDYSENRQSDKFEEFVFRTSRYDSLFEEKTKNVILIEDFPNIFLWNVKLFHEFLGKYASNGKNPIVFICTEDHSNELFPFNVKNKYNVTEIKFNPVNNSSMMKTLKRIMEENSDKITVSVETLENVSQNSNGDIRSALSSLQILLNGVKATRTAGKLTKRRKKTSQDLPIIKPITLKDTKLDFFHSIGRVLYPKRIPKEKPNPENKNRVFLYDVCEMTDNYTDGFLTLLNENYIHTFTKLTDVINASEIFSTCDLFGNHDDLKDYSGFICMVGTMVSNKEPKRGAFKALKKSNWSSLVRKNNLDKLTQFSEFNLTHRLLNLDLLPYLKFLPSSRSRLSYEDSCRLPSSQPSRTYTTEITERDVKSKLVLDDDNDDGDVNIEEFDD